MTQLLSEAELRNAADWLWQIMVGKDHWL